MWGNGTLTLDIARGADVGWLRARVVARPVVVRNSAQEAVPDAAGVGVPEQLDLAPEAAAGARPVPSPALPQGAGRVPANPNTYTHTTANPADQAASGQSAVTGRAGL